MISNVLSADIINGRRASRSVEGPVVPTHVVGRVVDYLPEVFTDPHLTVELSLYDLRPDGDVKLATGVWNGGRSDLPEVHWTGVAWRLCLTIETSQPVSAGAEIEF